MQSPSMQAPSSSISRGHEQETTQTLKIRSVLKKSNVRRLPKNVSWTNQVQVHLIPSRAEFDYQTKYNMWWTKYDVNRFIAQILEEVKVIYGYQPAHLSILKLPPQLLDVDEVKPQKAMMSRSQSDACLTRMTKSYSIDGEDDIMNKDNHPDRHGSHGMT
eukprot:CAMPEP_0113943236 /NCGR_PEP_ID=MMETSP1339-20121228/21822_1 /TAXON_ID=94617 /ORGANISM="Fibrocapsa japonica" /LENGTH=159 /DNA_ID=CAMNT_0000948059 /DNA_START=190 /DNA_END=669 /DNA_ORIENTATION=- /assembly_acc=CAM_ASM_000762